MQLTSQHYSTIFWRIFSPTDIIYAFGRWEGLLSPGRTVSFHLPEERLQLEIKKDWLGGEHLVKPGKIWTNDDDIVFENGSLVLPRLTFIEALPNSLYMSVGQTQPIIATGFYNNNTYSDISETLNWVSSPSGIVAINNAGLVVGVAAGITEVRGIAISGIKSTICTIEVIA